MPFWKLAHNVKDLSLLFDPMGFAEVPEHMHCEEQSEAISGAFELLPSMPPTSKSDINSLHYAIASRVVITAARGGRLRRTRFSNGYTQPPFAIRALLPFWLGLEYWELENAFTTGNAFMVDINDDDDDALEDLSIDTEAWIHASGFRSFVGHAALWLGQAGSTQPREVHSLTRQDVQGLQAFYAFSNTPDFQPYTVGRYLPWLSQDADLAQQVADAWNEIVNAQRTYRMWCDCPRCKKEQLTRLASM